MYNCVLFHWEKLQTCYKNCLYLLICLLVNIKTNKYDKKMIERNITGILLLFKRIKDVNNVHK